MKNKLVRLLCIIILLVPGLHISVKAQNNTTSPYSRFGIGETQFNSLARYLAMGGTAIGTNDSIYVNYENPASYTAIGKYTIFDMGGRATLSKIADANHSATNNAINLSHFFIAFPIKQKYWAMNIGFMPYSSSGYGFAEPKTLTGGSNYTIKYNGTGGLNRIVWGNGFTLYRGLVKRAKYDIDTISNRVLKRIVRDTMPERSRLSLGVNLSYLFGNLNNESAAYFPDTLLGFNSRQVRSTRVDGLGVQAGLQYIRHFKKGNVLTLGATYNLGNALAAKEKLFVSTFIVGSTGVDVTVDTLINQQQKNGEITLPSTYGVGFSLRQKNIWQIGADFSYTNWNNYRYFGQADNYLANSYKASIGMQIVPEPDGKKFSLRRTAYRVGARYGRSYLNINNTAINEWGVGAGIGFLLNPVGLYARVFKVPFSSINISAEYGRLGTTQNNLVREDFIRLAVSVTFCDKWFNKYKYD